MSDDLKRRRSEFLRQLGAVADVRREYVRRLPADHATLIEINRTRAVVEFPNAPLKPIKRGPLGLYVDLVPERWIVPLDWLLIPGCLESDPRQRPLFIEA